MSAVRLERRRPALLAKSKRLVPEDCGHFPWPEQAKGYETRLTLDRKALGLPE